MQLIIGLRKGAYTHPSCMAAHAHTLLLGHETHKQIFIQSAKPLHVCLEDPVTATTHQSQPTNHLPPITSHQSPPRTNQPAISLPAQHTAHTTHAPIQLKELLVHHAVRHLFTCCHVAWFDCLSIHCQECARPLRPTPAPDRLRERPWQ